MAIPALAEQSCAPSMPLDRIDYKKRSSSLFPSSFVFLIKLSPGLGDAAIIPHNVCSLAVHLHFSYPDLSALPLISVLGINALRPTELGEEAASITPRGTHTNVCVQHSCLSPRHLFHVSDASAAFSVE